MTEKLRLGPLARTEVVRLTVVLPAAVKANLDRYAELFGAAYGEVVDAAALAPHMLAAFMARDRLFRKACQAEGPVRGADASSRSTRAASSTRSVTAGESSAER